MRSPKSRRRKKRDGKNGQQLPRAPARTSQGRTRRRMNSRLCGKSFCIKNGLSEQQIPTTASSIPLVLLTVDNPIYRVRCEHTIHHLDQWRRNCSCCTQGEHNQCRAFEVHSCDMLNLEKHPAWGVKRIVFDGWRKVFLPKLIQDHSSSEPPVRFVLAAEDDIRVPDHLSSCQLVRICEEAFQRFPTMDVLSMGHSWKAIQKKNKRTPKDEINSNLLHYLQETKGAGVHGATLFALRFPEGVKRLLEALNRTAAERKQTHFDQFLFYSVFHDLKVALCDPPLVGWAEVDHTLTKTSSGYRRQGGGRWGFLPTGALGEERDLVWIERVLVERKEYQSADP